jgi:hypothetical protein
MRVGGGSGGSSSSAGGGSVPGAGGDYLFAVADVDVFGDDVAGVTLALQPGSAFSGRLVFDAGTSPPQTDLAKLQVSVSPPGGTSSSMSNGTTLGNSFSVVRPVPVKADGTFAIAGIGPGAYLLRCLLPPDLTRTWWLRSAIVGGRDVLDVPLEFEPGVNLSEATLTLTDKHSELSGTLQTGTGVPATEYFIVAFPADRTRWRAGSRRMVSTRPANDGRFVLTDLPGGEYVLAALADVDGDDWQKPEALERLAATGVKVTVRDGEKMTQDLRMTQ